MKRHFKTSHHIAGQPVTLNYALLTMTESAFFI